MKEHDYRRHLSDHTALVRDFISLLDAEMKKPSTVERGKRIASLSNQLEMANDKIRYHVLGVDFRKDKKPSADDIGAFERRRKG